MSNPLQTSKAFGAVGTVLLHILIIYACTFKVRQSITKPVPPAEPLRINLAEPFATSFQVPQIVSEMPETKPPVQAATIQDIAPLVQKTPSQAESGASNLPEVQSKPIQFAEPFLESASVPTTTMQHSEHEGETRAQMTEKTKQAVLSLLIASLEREKRYPAAARRLGIEGQVMASVHLNSQGRIISASAKGSESEPMLERATLEALQRVQKKWLPIPLTESMILNVPIRYSLE